MNTNPKEKTLRIDLRVRPQDKQKIQRLAKRCGLSVSEYVLKRALGYEPRAAPPDALFQFYRKLCDACNMLCEGYPQAEAALVSLAAQIQKELILPGKEKINGDPAKPALRGEEDSRSAEPFAACGESEERRGI